MKMTIYNINKDHLIKVAKQSDAGVYVELGSGEMMDLARDSKMMSVFREMDISGKGIKVHVDDKYDCMSIMNLMMSSGRKTA